MDRNIMSFEAELPGKRIIPESFQMICTRYYSITEFLTDKDVLEVGCGAGLGLGYMNRFANSIIGGDYSSLNIKIAKKHYQNRIELLLLDAHELPFKSESFDRIVAMEILLYLDVSKFLLECQKLLRENGMILVCIPNKDRKGFSASKLSRNYFSVPELFILFKKVNFEPNIYGAFKVRIGTSDEIELKKNKKKKFISLTGRILKAMPGGVYVKNFLGKKIFRKIVLPNELEPNMVEPIELVPLNPNEPNDEYKILYVFATKKN
jgi:ubiquinone/menaquinone biosynthesis C-methylase UbiE